MHPDLEKLITLQRLDLDAKRLRDEIAALPRLVASLETKASAVAGQRALVLSLIAKEESLRRSQESDVKDRQAKIARVRKQMDLATTTAQVTAFEHEIAFSQAEISRLEDAEIESMERSEALDAQKILADTAVLDAQALLEREKARAADTIARDKTALAAIEQGRGDLRPGVGEAILSTYDRIAKAKGTGISEGIDQKCSACQMLVRPQRWNDLRDRSNDETIMTCETCGRILYWDPARDAPQKKNIPHESIAAQIVRSL